MPELQQGVEIFVNWQTCLLCLTIYLLTQFLRSIVENAPPAKAFANGWFWKTVALPATPIGMGIVLSLVCKKFPFPMPVSNSLSVKIMYGMVCGMTCGWVYARIRDWFGSGGQVIGKSVTPALNRPTSEPGSIPPPTPNS